MIIPELEAVKKHRGYSMGQNREAPAYQEYAASMLSKLPFRAMTLDERGLLYTMRLECWVNHKLPSDNTELSKVLGVSVLASSLQSVMPFFEVVAGFIVCPELDNYRAHLDDIKKRQSEGGKRGAERTNKKRQPRKNTSNTSTPPSTSQVPRRVGVGSLVQSSPVQLSKDQLSGKDDYSYVDENGEDPLDKMLCRKCNGEGCEWCKEN